MVSLEPTANIRSLVLRAAALTLMASSFVINASLAQESGAPSITVSKTNPRQGETIEVVIGGNYQSSPPPKLVFDKQSVTLFPGLKEGTWRALLAVPADLEPGTYNLKVDKSGVPVHVIDGGFQMQTLRLPPAKDNFDMSPGEKEAIEKAKCTVTETRQWQGAFVSPSKARQSAQFGIKRKVNGRVLKDYYHSGLDFAASMGSPVLSCAGGTVILAAKGYKLHGNVVAVDHGQGVVSFYIHLLKIDVKVGDKVQAGQAIGRVGATGRATGPHLHFTLDVNQVSTNPKPWFAKTFVACQ